MFEEFSYCLFCFKKVFFELSYYHAKECAIINQNNELSTQQAVRDILIYLVSGKNKLNNKIIFDDNLKKETITIQNVIWHQIRFNLPTFNKLRNEK